MIAEMEAAQAKGEKMGYDTDFKGAFKITPTLQPHHLRYLQRFAATRRMRRNEFKTMYRPDPVRRAVGLPVGAQGGYFVGEDEDEDLLRFFNNNAYDVIDRHEPPIEQPGLWCRWAPNDAGTELKYTGVEKFYNYIDWLDYLTVNFFMIWDYVLNGRVVWQGERMEDRGVIIMVNNIVSVRRVCD